MSNIGKYERAIARQKPETVIDKIRLWYWQQDTPDYAGVDQIVLTSEQELTRKRLEMVHFLLTDGLPNEELIPEVKRLCTITTDRQAYNLIRQAKELYGDLEETSKKAFKVMQIQRRRKLIRDISQDDKLDPEVKYMLIHKMELSIEKMGGAFDKDTLSYEELKQLLQRPDVVVSPDERILDIPHEELE